MKTSRRSSSANLIRGRTGPPGSPGTPLHPSRVRVLPPRLHEWQAQSAKKGRELPGLAPEKFAERRPKLSIGVTKPTNLGLSGSRDRLPLRPKRCRLRRYWHRPRRTRRHRPGRNRRHRPGRYMRKQGSRKRGLRSGLWRSEVFSSPACLARFVPGPRNVRL